MLEFSERQIRDAEQQGAYARRRIPETDAYNRTYYEKEVERCTKRIAAFEPDVAALKHVIAMLETTHEEP
jgi:hypothetical protein